jgi:hypothetical protein
MKQKTERKRTFGGREGGRVGGLKIIGTLEKPFELKMSIFSSTNLFYKM